MYANIVNNTIEMTKSEAKAAGKLNSKEFNELRELRVAYPNSRIVVKTAPKAKDSLKGLTVPYMEKYIKGHENDENTRLSQFYQLRGKDSTGKQEIGPSASYGELKMWFLSEYPDFEKFGEEVDKILSEAKKKRAAQRAAKAAA